MEENTETEVNSVKKASLPARFLFPLKKRPPERSLHLAERVGFEPTCP